MEEILRREIVRRKKEKFKRNGNGIHKHRDTSDNNKQKRIKMDEEGKYKTIVQKEGTEREEKTVEIE